MKSNEFFIGEKIQPNACFRKEYLHFLTIHKISLQEKFRSAISLFLNAQKLISVFFIFCRSPSCCYILRTNSTRILMMISFGICPPFLQEVLFLQSQSVVMDIVAGGNRKHLPGCTGNEYLNKIQSY